MKPRSPRPTHVPLCPSVCLALSLACSRSTAPADAHVTPAEPARQQQTAAPTVAAAPLPAALPAPAASPSAASPSGVPVPAGSKPGASQAIASHAGAPKAKLSAPAEVHVTTSGTSGEVQATLTMRATADIPRCVARFVVPAGVTVTAGEREKDWGSVASGEQRQMQVTLLVPAQGSFVIAGGADLYLSSGIRLHQGDAVQLGR